MKKLIAEAGYWDMLTELVHEAVELAEVITTLLIKYGNQHLDAAEADEGVDVDQFNAEVDKGLQMMDKLTSVKRAINDVRTIYDTEGEDAAVIYLRAYLLDGSILSCKLDTYQSYDRAMDMSLCRLICEILARGDRPDKKTIDYVQALSYRYDL